MAKPWKEIKHKNDSPETRARIEAKVKAMQLDIDLREMRKLAGKSQVAVAKAMGIAQPQVSQLERRPDHLMSTLENYAKALGGELEVNVRFGDRALRLRGIRGFGELAATAGFTKVVNKPLVSSAGGPLVRHKKVASAKPKMLARRKVGARVDA